MALFYTDEEGARVCVQDFFPEENIYEEKTTLLYTFIKFDGDDEELLNIEQRLLEVSQKLKLDYVGWRFVDSWLEVYFYGEHAKGFENSLNEALKPQYQFESGNRKDKKYETYYKMLMPNDKEYHNIQSEEIIADLEDSGDNLEADHRIEYHAVFMTSSQRKRFTASIEEAGFSYLQDFLDEKAEDDFVYGVVFTKFSPVSIELLNKQTEDIFPLIKVEHGRYEGWGTESLESVQED